MRASFLAALACISSLVSVSGRTSTSSLCPNEIVAKDLLFNVGAFSSLDVGLPGGSEDESLSTAICCDPVFSKYAEPNSFFSDPSIRLFTRVSSTAVNTFYDSSCGLPVYQAPVGRSFEEWKADTEEHGW